MTNQQEFDAQKDAELEEQAVEITRKIVNSVSVDEDDKEILDKKDDSDKFELQMQFDQFLNKKIDVDNSDGGDPEKIKTGIDILDCISGGGFNIGAMTMLVGLPGTCKSTLLSQIISYNQKVYNGEMLCVYYDTEASMTTRRLQQLGVNNPAIKPYNDITIEQLFQTIEAMCAYKEAKNIKIPSIIAWDSIANTSTLAERGTDNINSTMGLKQKLLSQLLPRYLSKMCKYKICLLCTNQLRDKMSVGPYGAPSDLQHMSSFDIPGGKAVKFNSSHLLFLRSRGDLKLEQYDFAGVQIEAQFIKNKSFSPFIPVQMLFNFKTGVDNFYTNYKLLADNDRLKTGAWNSLVVYPEKKFRTKDAKTVYNEDPKFKELFDSEVQSVLKTEYIDRY